MEKVLEVKNLSTHFFTRRGVVKAVNEVNLSLYRGEVLGLVGESGSGKTVTGFSILGAVDPPGKIVSGEIIYKGKDILGQSETAWRKLRGAGIAMIFQDPMMTLNPVLRIDTQMIEAVLAHEDISKESARQRAREALARVGMGSPDERLKSYPHQFSGGMRQRVAIAIALLNKSDIIIADEPTTALDVTIQSQILFEMQSLLKEQNIALIWITHDLTVVAGLARRICVMYAGMIVESGLTSDVLDRPLNPYTKGLVDSVPSKNRKNVRLYQIPGMTPSLLNLPTGCSFAPRCSRARPRCNREMPGETISEDGRMVRCHYPYK